MSNIGTKTVRNNHRASGKSQRAPKPAIASAPHHITYLAPSAGRSSRPAQPSTPDSSSLLTWWRRLFSAPGGTKQPGTGWKSWKVFFFSLSSRSDCASVQHPPTHAALHKVLLLPPARYWRQELRKAHREGKQRFRLTHYSLSVSSWTHSPQTGNGAFNL